MLIIKSDGLCLAWGEKILMKLDSHSVHIDLKSRQAALLLERLETLRGELGVVAEDIIKLLRNAGVTPPAKPGSACRKKTRNG
jgi:hypothetical protein